MIYYTSDIKNEVKDNYLNLIKLELNKYKNTYNKLIISIQPVFDSFLFNQVESKYIAQTIVKDQLDVVRESNYLANKVNDYVVYSRNGKNLINIKVKVEKL